MEKSRPHDHHEPAHDGTDSQVFRPGFPGCRFPGTGIMSDTTMMLVPVAQATSTTTSAASKPFFIPCRCLPTGDHDAA
jgi:hypothetical protein